jgi:transcriptional regulator with XRE-family HTH domain
LHYDEGADRRHTAEHDSCWSLGNGAIREESRVRTLREWRCNELLSVRELALRAGVTPKTVTDIEYGRRKPTYETMRSICAALGIGANEISEFAATLQSRGMLDNRTSQRPQEMK